MKRGRDPRQVVNRCIWTSRWAADKLTSPCAVGTEVVILLWRYYSNVG